MIRAVPGDLASAIADAVVRPATTRLEPLTSALRRLDDAAGPRFEEQRRVARDLAVGAAVVTGAGELGAEFVVHLVLADREDEVTADAVRRATAAALWQCTQWGIQTLACPVPPGETLGTMVAVLRDHMRNADLPAIVYFMAATAADAESLNARLGQDGP